MVVLSKFICVVDSKRTNTRARVALDYHCYPQGSTLRVPTEVLTCRLTLLYWSETSMSENTPEQFLKMYKGKALDVTWDQRLCLHVGECGRADNQLFKQGREPWCVPDELPAEDAAEGCERCPTGALTYTRHDEGPSEMPGEENRVHVANNGPLYFQGELDIDETSGMPGVAFRAALCRCGKSENKPFCNNAHEEHGFVDRGAIGGSGPGLPGGLADGELRVTPQKNGPLLLKGNFKLISSSGRVAFEGTKVALCRCGASKNKPFCDGAHNAVGFMSE